MSDQNVSLIPSLKGKKGLIVGIANEQSIAWGCAKAYKALGAELAVTYLNEKAERFVRPLAEQIDASIICQADVTRPGEMEAVFAEVEKKWGKLDFLLHAIAFAPMDDLHGRVVDSSRDGFLLAMDVSCHSVIRMAKMAEPLMKDGGAIQTVSYLGSEKVVDNYNMMGPVKAALESVVRYLAAELGPKSIRVNTISPGPLKTRAASGIGKFDELIEKVIARTPTHNLTTIEEVGAMSAFLMTDLARSVNGELIYIDGGYNMMG
ncbi:enoyl-ACP reductase FabI [Microvirga sp. W0021]|uniref:Enoyl-[acyl-carrier-protein] reductase [NADH] n=1 Tax=Hohaiivirga grylli TaxID=3133970 RepID=A0ABV0BHE1_9HYPH